MKNKYYFWLFSCLIAFFQNRVFAQADIEIQLNKTKNAWSLTYVTNIPAQKITFVSTPDGSRVLRWKPVNNEFEVLYQNNQEYIQRKDGKSFSHVSLHLTPTYKYLPKTYAPFAPFSDGSALIHTGRLFACVNQCAEDANGWRIKFKVEENTHFIANGKIIKHSASWLGYDDGQYVYIGHQKPINKPSFVALIDQGLPDKIKVKLIQTLPQIMAFFETRLGKLTGSVKPMLFASYSNKKGNDMQGGTLPNQIFMHWDMDNLNYRLKDKNFANNTLWVFAHEAAHFYQNNIALANDKSESWLHEGNAEWLAALALREFYPETIEPFIEKKFSEAKAKCIVTLKKYALVDAAKHGNYRAYYQCGLIVHALIDKKARELSKQKYSIFSVWNTYKGQVASSGKKGTASFWLATKKYIPNEMIQALKKLTTDKLESPKHYIDKLETL